MLWSGVNRCISKEAGSRSQEAERGTRDDRSGFRLRDRGRGIGGLRARRPAHRGRPIDRLVIESGGFRPLAFHSDAGGARHPDELQDLQLGVSSEPEPHLNGRRISCPRGKVLGGSSSINGLVYVRGHPLDFERWEEEGARGWGYGSVLPYFRRAESFRWGRPTPIAARAGRSHTRRPQTQPALRRVHRGGP